MCALFDPKEVDAPRRMNWRYNRLLSGAALLGLLLGYGIAVWSLSLRTAPVSELDINSIITAPASPCPPLIGASVRPADLQYHGHEGAGVCEHGAAKGIQLQLKDSLVSPVVIVAYNRVHYLAKAMMSVFQAWQSDPSNQQKFPLFVSGDGEVQHTLLFATAWHEAAGVQVISRVQNATTCNDAGCNLTGHYLMLLQLFLDCLSSPRILFLEEDLEVAPDIFSYFENTSPLLDQDPSLWCISAWNDHGQPGRAINSTALYRTDIIPGLGWMIDRKHGLQLAAKWPDREWDEWMRRADVRRGLQCIYPEMPRTHTFGKVGAHGGLYFDEYLAPMVINNQNIDWRTQDLDYLLQDKYAELMGFWISQAQDFLADNTTSLGGYCNNTLSTDATHMSDLLVEYDSLQAANSTTSFTSLAREVGHMMEGLVLGKVPRASYNGVVVVRCRGRRLFLVPSTELPGKITEGPRLG